MRNFNINLFNHLAIKELSQHNEKIKDLMLINPKETIEKLLIILENFVVYSWYNNQGQWGSYKQGLLGTSKAISKWDDKDAISFDINKDFKDIELLTSQKTTGVNGTYKGSFVSMHFFEKDYSDYFEDEKIMSDIEKKFLPKFQILFDEVLKYFKNNEKLPNKELQNLYTKIFAQHEKIAQDTKPFWLKYLGFDSNEAKAIYKVIDNVELNNGYLDYKKIIEEANYNFESKKFQDILSLEPKLSYLESVFNYLLSCDGEEFKEIEKSDCIDFSKVFFEDEISRLETVDNEAIKRLQKMININDIKSLLDYHSEIMILRDQKEWIEIKDNKISINTFSTNLEINEDTLCEKKENRDWNRNYYINSVYSIKKGLENENI